MQVESLAYIVYLKGPDYPKYVMRTYYLEYSRTPKHRGMLGNLLAVGPAQRTTPDYLKYSGRPQQMACYAYFVAQDFPRNPSGKDLQRYGDAAEATRGGGKGEGSRDRAFLSHLLVCPYTPPPFAKEPSILFFLRRGEWGHCLARKGGEHAVVRHDILSCFLSCPL